MNGLPLLEPIWWNWYLLGVVLMGLELLVPGAVLVWFGLGALACGLLVESLNGLFWPLQILFFLFFSLVSLALGRRFIKKATPAKHSTLNRRLSQLIGRKATLEAPIVNGKGRLRLGDTYWLVCGPNLTSGTEVVVAGMDGSTLIVEEVVEKVVITQG